jgi:hypothetical protein
MAVAVRTASAIRAPGPASWRLSGPVPAPGRVIPEVSVGLRGPRLRPAAAGRATDAAEPVLQVVRGAAEPVAPRPAARRTGRTAWPSVSVATATRTPAVSARAEGLAGGSASMTVPVAVCGTLLLAIVPAGRTPETISVVPRRRLILRATRPVSPPGPCILLILPVGPGPVWVTHASSLVGGNG